MKEAIELLQFEKERCWYQIKLMRSSFDRLPIHTKPGAKFNRLKKTHKSCIKAIKILRKFK